MIRKIRHLRPSLLLLAPLVSNQSHISKTLNPNPSLSLLSVSSPPKTSPALLSRFAAPLLSRPFSSSSSPSGVVLVSSEEEYKAAFNKIQDEKMPGVFYFTATWCGPCRFISPVIEDMSKKFPHVTTYKIDIDQKALGSTLNELKISAVPTLHFYKDGEKATEVVGADVARLKDTMENLYNGNASADRANNDLDSQVAPLSPPQLSPTNNHQNPPSCNVWHRRGNQPKGQSHHASVGSLPSFN